MPYIHVEYLNEAYAVTAVYAVPAKYRECFHWLDGYYTHDLRAIFMFEGELVRDYGWTPRKSVGGVWAVR